MDAWGAARVPRWLVILLALIAGGTLTITLVDSDDDGKPDTVTVVVNAESGDGQPAKTIEVPEAVVDRTRAAVDHEDLEAAPPGADLPTDAQLERAADVQADVKALPEGGAVQGFAGCVTRILPVNFSSRNGSRATWQVLHYTVSSNRPGWSDVNAIIALFSNPGRQASSNFVIDTEGNCAYIVPIEAKAWTQAGGNPWSISYEIIATGGEPRYLEPAGMAKLRSVMRQVAARTGIPLTRGAVSSSGTPLRAGTVQHKDGGLSWGGHVDITPFAIEQVLRELAFAAPASKLTAREQRLVVAACAAGKTGGHSPRFWRGQARAQAYKIRLARKRSGAAWKVRDRGVRRLRLARAAAGKCS